MNSSKPLKFSLKELAELTNSVLQGDPDHEISGFEYLDAAENGDASFLANPRYKEALLTTRAGVVCVTQEFQEIAKSNLLISQDPSGTFQKIIEAFSNQIDTKSGFKGIHPSAIIHPSAQLGTGVEVGPLAVIDEDVVVGDNTIISAHVCIGKGVKIGRESFFHPGVIVREMCEIGDRVILQPGAVIGSCGFGYLPTKEGKHIKLAQVGIVVIENDVEIGANTTIDRARFKETRISRGTKIDNLVQIGHNVILGTDNIIIAQTGIAGSTKTGKHVCLAGQTGVVGHVKIGDGVIVAAKGGVSKSIDEPGKYAGVPIMPLREHNEQQVHLRNISRYVAEIKELKKKIQAIEAQI